MHVPWVKLALNRKGSPSPELSLLFPFFSHNIHAKAGEEENRRTKRNIPDAYRTFLHRCCVWRRWKPGQLGA